MSNAGIIPAFFARSLKIKWVQVDLTDDLRCFFMAWGVTPAQQYRPLQAVSGRCEPYLSNGRFVLKMTAWHLVH